MDGVDVQYVAALDKKDKRVSRLTAGSFRDMTRITDSDPVLWTAISGANSANILRALGAFTRELARDLAEMSRLYGRNLD